MRSGTRRRMGFVVLAIDANSSLRCSLACNGRVLACANNEPVQIGNQKLRDICVAALSALQ
jgi:hypothetical protein